MSTPQSIPRTIPRFRIGFGALLTAVGVLVAIAVSIAILTLTSTNHTTVATPVTASQASTGTRPQVHYRGPRQVQAAFDPQNRGTTPRADTGNSAPHYSCLGAAQRCLR